MIPALQYGLLALCAINLSLWLLLVRRRFISGRALSMDSDGHQGSSPFHEVSRILGALLLGLVVIGKVPPIEAANGLDPSWQMVLEHATLHKLIYGKDIVFTFGPLAPVSTDLHNGAGHFHNERFAYTLWMASVFVVLWWKLSLRLPRLLVLLSWFWLLIMPGDATSYAALALLAWAMKSAEHEPPASWILASVVAPVGLAILGAVKFTYTVAALAVVAAWVGHAVVFQRSWKQALAPFLSALTTFMLVWTATGQPLAAFPRWLQWGLNVSSAYAEAMQVITVTPTALWLAAGTVILSLAMLSLVALWQGRSRRTSDLFLALVCLGLLAIVWKHSVTRADGHLSMIGSMAPLLCCLALTPSSIATLPRQTRTAGLAMVIALMGGALALQSAIFGTPLKESLLSLVTKPAAHLMSASQSLTTRSSDLPMDLSTAPALDQSRLPTFRALVKDQPVDVFNFLQCTAFANGLNYQPRPVYQSYQACDAKLMGLNEAYWKSRTSTHHLICRMESVDWRLNASDDAACWPHWLTNLTPSATENDFVLLSPAREKTYNPEWSVVSSGEAKMGAPLPVPTPPPSRLLRLRATIQRSLRGKIVKAAFQPDAVQMETAMADGTTEITRIVPGALEAGVLLTPYLHTNVDLLAYYGKDFALQRKPSSITFQAERGRNQEFAPSFGYVWESCSVPELTEANIQHSRELLRASRIPFPGRAPQLLGEALPGSVMQLSLRSLINIDLDGRPSLRLDAPSKIILQNDRRGGKLEISYMVPSPSWKRKKPTDGVRFLIATAGHDGRENILMDHFLDPGKQESDREKKTFSVTLPPNEAPWLVLRTETGPTDYQDRAVWGGFTWTPTAEGKP